MIRASADNPPQKAFVRLDYRQAQGITDQSRNWVFGKIRDRLKVEIEIKVENAEMLNDKKKDDK